MSTTENLLAVGGSFLNLFIELLLLFVGISFIVGLLQIYISRERIKRILTTRHKGLNSILGALLGSVTPFCSCSTVPILVGLLKSGAPFSGAMSFLLSSPVLNPMIIILFLKFFGLKATIIYAAFTFVFAVVMGLILEKLGFEREVKNVTISGGKQDDVSFDSIKGSFWGRHRQAFKFAALDAVGLFKGVLPYLILGAAIGAVIHGFIPENFLSRFAGANNVAAVPVAAVLGIPMYIRAATMIPIASVLIGKGVAYGVVVALIIGGAGASIPELSLLGSIFKKKMMIAFVLCIFLVAVITGFVFNILM